MTSSLSKIEKTDLWRNTLGNIDENEFRDERELLRQTFVTFRNKIIDLVAQISVSVPELTKHDISHLDGLWGTASMICGEGYPLNPLEGFVLGGAILLHDAALCVEAYNNGLDGIRATITWKDIYKSIGAEESSEESKLKMADFTALRVLHAEQSSMLIEKSWKLPDKDQEVYLIDDYSLRISLGTLIGKIAASHHWDIEKLSTLKSQINAPNGFPSDWRINPIKIACILRCADAAHVNNERAPDFLYALLKRSGISFQHWQSQNRISGPALDEGDKTRETLIYTSTHPFRENEAKSWWVAYDLLTLLNKEIISCNNLLTSLNPNYCFKIKQIKGVGSSETLKDYIEVDGWNPINVKVHVSNIEKLVANLGGEQLYGINSDKFQICLRELIQNARDSINARRVFDSDFKGKILIRVLEEGDSQYLIVEDNGLGMSERVLTGSLLDFGTSFWTSSLVNSEFPGLRSSEFKSVGRFGIGFYSVFMIANEVLITSRPWTGGLDQINQLYFENGVSLRPVFKKAKPNDFKLSTNCQIKLKLKEDVIKRDLTFRTIDQSIEKKEFEIPMTAYISRICSGLDTSVYFSDASPEVKVHESILSETFDTKLWLHSISYSKYQSTSTAAEIIDNDYERLTPIFEANQLVGYAALLVKSAPFLKCSTIGGLGINVLNFTSDRYLGYIEKKVSSAKREDGNEYLPSNSTLSKWAAEQLRLIETDKLNIIERTFLTDSMCHFGANPVSFAQVLVNESGNFMSYSIPNLVQLATIQDVVFFKVRNIGIPEVHSIPNSFNGCLIIQPLSQGDFFNLRFENDEPETNFSLVSQLHTGLITLGKTPKWEFKETDLLSKYFNMQLEAIILTCK